MGMEENIKPYNTYLHGWDGHNSWDVKLWKNILTITSNV